MAKRSPKRSPTHNLPKVSLRGRGWCCIGPCIALVRMPAKRGFAVGLQGRFRSSGTGAVWPTLAQARRRGEYLANLYNLFVLEAI